MNMNTSPSLPKATPFPTASPSFYPPIPSNPPPKPELGNYNLQDNLFKKVVDRFQQHNLSTSGDMDRLLLQGRQLSEGEAYIEQEFRALSDIKERLKYNNAVLETKLEQIDVITDKVNAMPDVQVDETLCGTTVVSNQ
jgi:ESCRT-I complex subunit TSG101